MFSTFIINIVYLLFNESLRCFFTQIERREISWLLGQPETVEVRGMTFTQKLTTDQLLRPFRLGNILPKWSHLQKSCEYWWITWTSLGIYELILVICPVTVDVDESTYNIDTTLVRRRTAWRVWMLQGPCWCNGINVTLVWLTCRERSERVQIAFVSGPNGRGSSE